MTRDGQIMLASKSAFGVCRTIALAAVLWCGSAPWQISGAIDDGQRITLTGHVNPRARAALDAGEVSGSLPMTELQLVFRRSASQAQALEKLLADQQDRKSSQYHHWLSPAQFGSRFGATDRDVAAASAWLKSQGFVVGNVPAGHGYLPFTGIASQVESAFQTQIHSFNVNGEQHYAAIKDPSIPAAFQNLIAAVGGLHDFYPRPSGAASPPLYSAGNNTLLAVPADVATAYNFSPLYQAGINGNGVSIAVVGESDVQSSIVTQYWTAVGVNQDQQFTSMPVPAGDGGTDPGQTNDSNETEAYLDIEIIGALAPASNIILVRDKNSGRALQYAIDQNLAPVLNISFGECEFILGTDGNAAVQSIYQQAAGQGVTVLAAAGDSGIASCDDSIRNMAGDGVVHGLSVNGLASSPYNVAVGGTDFNFTLPLDLASTNAPGTLATVQGYLPEMVWNFSCANPIYVTYLKAADALTLCNSPTAASDGLNLIGGGGGGLSNCNTLSTTSTCVSGYAQPSWQSGVAGIQNFGARAMPDVALLANRWVICDQTVTSCAPSGNQGYIAEAGTSAAAPMMSAIVALVNQAIGGTAGRQGNLNPQLYSLAAVEYGSAQSPNSANLSSCNSSNGQTIGTGCVFNDITAGSNAQPCSVANYTGGDSGSTPGATCASASGDTFGIVELNGAAVYAAAGGYDLASGLGSLNAGNFINAVYGLQVAPQGLKAVAGSSTSVTLTWTADPVATGYNIYDASSAGQEGTKPALSNVSGTTATVSALNSGQPYYFLITALTPYGESARSGEVALTLPPAAPTGVSAVGSATSVQLTWTASTGATSYSVYQGAQPGAESTTPVASGLTSTTYMVSGSAGQSFYFKVAAVNAGGTSALSSEAGASVSVPASSHGGGSMSLLDVILGALAAALTIWRRRRLLELAA